MKYTIAHTSIKWMRKVFGIDYTLYVVSGPGLEKPYVVTSEEKALEHAVIFEAVFLAGKKSRGGPNDTT
jgi:hypothetical protein